MSRIILMSSGGCALLLVLVIAAWVSFSGARASIVNGQEVQKDRDQFSPVKEVREQAEAIREALMVDLPLLEKTDKVIIEHTPHDGGRRRITLEKPAEIKELRQALKASRTPTSAGVTVATVSFYRGERLLRRIWVFEQGEWGFERPGISWTTGREENLWRVIQKRLK